MLNSEVKSKIRSMSDKQLGEILWYDCFASPPIPIDQINDYLCSMTEEEKIQEEIIFQVMDELVVRHKRNISF